MKISGVFLCLLFPAMTVAECGLPAGEVLVVAQVSDGDTLKLQDGRSVRILGINAPEITHGNKTGQPFGRESRAAARAFIAAGNNKIRLGFEREFKDRYGRLLAHVYDQRGRSLAAAQLRNGMAMQATVPPNDAQVACLGGFEQAARQQSLGLWRHRYWQPLSIKAMHGDETGFRLVRGRITSVEINSAVWLEFDGKLVARVAKKDWPVFGFQRSDWLSLKGRSVELRGWISRPKAKRSPDFKPLIMQLRSPSSMKVIDL